MKISLFQGILFAVCGVAALVGLFVFATYTSNSSGSNGVGTVVIWGVLPEADIQAFLDEISKTEVTLKSVSYVEKNPATLPNDLAAAIATGTGPDLVLASQEELHALAKFITPILSTQLSPATFTSAFIEGGQIFAAADGYYGVPFLVDPLVLFSNRTILSSSGIAKAPTTWEGLTGLVPGVAVMTPARQIVRGLIALGTYDNVHNSRGILSTLFIQTGVPLTTAGSSGGLNVDLGEGISSSGNASVGQAVLGFYTQFADPSKVSYTWNASLRDSQQAFLAGDLALYLGFASEAKFIKAANANLNFGVTPVPQPATASAKSVYGLVYTLMTPIGAKNPAGAYQAAVLLSNPAEQIAAATATGLAPVTLNELATAPADPIAAVAYAEALYTKGWLSPLPVSTDAIFSSMITDVITGRSNPSSALTSAGRALSALLQ